MKSLMYFSVLVSVLFLFGCSTLAGKNLAFSENTLFCTPGTSFHDEYVSNRYPSAILEIVCTNFGDKDILIKRIDFKKEGESENVTVRLYGKIIPYQFSDTNPTEAEVGSPGEIFFSIQPQPLLKEIKGWTSQTIEVRANGSSATLQNTSLKLTVVDIVSDATHTQIQNVTTSHIPVFGRLWYEHMDKKPETKAEYCADFIASTTLCTCPEVD